MTSTTEPDRSTVGCPWRVFSLDPHRPETFEWSPDPRFVETVSHKLHHRHRSAEFRASLDAVDAAGPAELDRHIVTGNCGTRGRP